MNWQAVIIAAVILLSIAGAIVEPLLPEPRYPGVYMPGPDNGVLPFQ